MMNEWVDVTIYSKQDRERIPRVYVRAVGKFRIIIINHRNKWLMEINGVHDCVLKSESAQDAQFEALGILRTRLLESLFDVEEALKARACRIEGFVILKKH